MCFHESTAKTSPTRVYPTDLGSQLIYPGLNKPATITSNMTKALESWPQGDFPSVPPRPRPGVDHVQIRPWSVVTSQTLENSNSSVGKRNFQLETSRWFRDSKNICSVSKTSQHQLNIPWLSLKMCSLPLTFDNFSYLNVFQHFRAVFYTDKTSNHMQNRDFIAWLFQSK